MHGWQGAYCYGPIKFSGLLSRSDRSRGSGYNATLTGSLPRVGQNHIYAVYIQYFWQGKH